MKQIFTLVISILSFSTFAQSWDEIIKTVASDRAAGDRFGISVSISGNKAVVGADKKNSNTGAAYVFELNGGVWTETAKLEASDGAVDDYFGDMVGISGNKIVIGAYLQDFDASGGSLAEDAGAVYIFELNNDVWSETAKLVASDRTTGDNLGRNVSISGDRVIIGAWKESHDAMGGTEMTAAGSAYIFELDGNVWSQTAKLVASDRDTDDNFGYDVSISGDKAIVGARLEDHDASGATEISSSGSAYIFELDGGTWTETAKLVASDRAVGDYFGYSVSIDGDKAIVGSYLDNHNGQGSSELGDVGSAYIFEVIGGVWTETAKLIASDADGQDRFGISVGISGNKAIIGAYKQDLNATGTGLLQDAGAAYIFELTGGTWSETEKIIASDRSEDDYFGYRVDISGNKIIVAAIQEEHDVLGGTPLAGAGSAYMFTTCDINPTITISNYTLSTTLTDVTYQWLDCNDNNSIIAGATNQTYTPSENGNYALIINDGICADTSNCLAVAGLGVNTLTKAGFKMYPNPASQNITLDLGSLNQVNISIHNSMGEEIYKTQTNNQTKFNISLAEFSNGIYFVNVQIGTEVFTQKIVKQ